MVHTLARYERGSQSLTRRRPWRDWLESLTDPLPSMVRTRVLRWLPNISRHGYRWWSDQERRLGYGRSELAFAWWSQGLWPGAWIGGHHSMHAERRTGTRRRRMVWKSVGGHIGACLDIHIRWGEKDRDLRHKFVWEGFGGTRAQPYRHARELKQLSNACF